MKVGKSQEFETLINEEAFICEVSEKRKERIVPKNQNRKQSLAFQLML